MSEKERADLLADINTLVTGFSTVLMATCSDDGDPEISYSPYVIFDGRLHVFVSDLSVHTGNLKSNPRASLLFIESESEAENLHARRRVTFPVTATLIARDDPTWESVLNQMQQQFGEIIPVLKSLPDFHLFAMQTESAVIVRGFADAHTVACEGFNFALD